MGVHSFDTNEVQIDLREGIVSGYSPYIEFLTSPNHSPNGQCNSQAVIKVDLSGRYRSINLFLEYGDIPRQWTLDISDSETGDGNGGDNGTTGNMAETQICNRQLRIYGNNRPGHMDVSANGGLLMKIVDNFVKKGAKVNLNISDENVEWAHGKKRGHLESEFLFTLNGQKPSYGDVDYNIYIAFNRVVAGAYRNGSGLCKANIVLLDKPGKWNVLFHLLVLTFKNNINTFFFSLFFLGGFYVFDRHGGKFGHLICLFLFLIWTQ